MCHAADDKCEVMSLAHLVPVPVGRDASVGDAHAEASYTSKLICRGQIKGIRLTLVASQTRCVFLKRGTSENRRCLSTSRHRGAH